MGNGTCSCSREEPAAESFEQSGRYSKAGLVRQPALDQPAPPVSDQPPPPPASDPAPAEAAEQLAVSESPPTWFKPSPDPPTSQAASPDPPARPAVATGRPRIAVELDAACAACTVCGKEADSRCADCQQFWYCSEYCQRLDWVQTHHAECKGMAAAQRQAAAEAQAQKKSDSRCCCKPSKGSFRDSSARSTPDSSARSTSVET